MLTHGEQEQIKKAVRDLVHCTRKEERQRQNLISINATPPKRHSPALIAAQDRLHELLKEVG